MQCGLNPAACEMPPANASDEEAANQAVANAHAMGVPTDIEGSDIVKSPKLAKLFAAQNFANKLDEDDRPRKAELEALCNYINHLLKDDPEAKPYLPLTAPTMFDQLDDGVVLSRLLDNPKPGVLAPGEVQTPQANLSPAAKEAAKQKNAAKVLEGARAVGCDVNGVTPEDVASGNEDPVIQAVSELLRLQGLSDLPNKRGPEMDALRKPGETAADLRALPGETLAARWLNKHLADAGIPPRSDVDDDSVCKVSVVLCKFCVL